MLVSLTVTEEELLDLEVGQTGSANFDAIDGTEYPVRVVSISRVPNAEQRVVTYDVEALILTGPELADTEGARRAAGFRQGGGQGEGPPGGGFGGFELPEGVTPQQVRRMMTGLELPEGVTMQQVMRALASGGALPEGVVLPEGMEEVLQAFQVFQGSQGAARGAAAQGEPADEPGDTATRPLPALGMSASVTILTEIREESVLVPISAVRQLDGAWFVSVPAPSTGEEGVAYERVFVEVGESDGTNVEIAQGLEAGAVVLVGADTAGIAFSSSRQQLQSFTGLGTGQGDFGPGGGGGRR